MRDRLGRLIIELEDISHALHSLACGLYQLKRCTEHVARVVPTVILIDRVVSARALRFGMLLGVIHRCPVRTIESAEQVRELVSRAEFDEIGRLIAVSRLVYGRHYSLFQPLRRAGRLLVV